MTPSTNQVDLNPKSLRTGIFSPELPFIVVVVVVVVVLVLVVIT